MATTPDFYGPEQGSAFQDPSVVAAYHHRPPYPAAVFDLLASLIVDAPRIVLDVGCGTGALARRLAGVADRVDAVDVSAQMIGNGQHLPGGRDARVRWIVGRAEDAPLEPPYALITAGASLHWMDWDVVLPRFGDALTPRGVLAIVEDDHAPLPWQAELAEIIRRYSTNRSFDPGFDYLTELRRRGLFRPLGRVQTGPMSFRQPLDAYVESFHGRASFSRERMGTERAAAFDDEVRALVGAYRGDDVELGMLGVVTWGRPSPTPSGRR